MTAEHHDVIAILAWIPPVDRDRITDHLAAAAGPLADWTHQQLADACRAVGATRP